MKASHALVLALAAVAPACAPSRVPAPASAPAPALGARPDSAPVRSALVLPHEASMQVVSAEQVAEEISTLFDHRREPTAEGDGPPSWDIDVDRYGSHDRVEHYVRLFSGRARDYVASRLQRGTRYEPMVRSTLREAGLPEDLYYLAFVESGYDPHAYSRAAAVGMWQFMTTTARAVGLRVDWWVDERRDPVRSTQAAARHLRHLRREFGSLYLAVAAYNGGSGRVSRGLDRFAEELEGTEGDDLFFALAERDYLRRETREYVPQLIAAAIVAKDAQRYGLRVRSEEPLAYDSVTVPGGTPLTAIATAADTSLAAIQELNPHLLRGITPPGGEYLVRVPRHASIGFDLRFAGLAPTERVGFTRVTSEHRGRLSAIAKSKGLTERQVAMYNPDVRRLKPSGLLVGGQTILVPTPAALRGALDVPDPAVERYGTSRAPRRHTVRAGETLTSIGRKYGVSPATLRRLNGLKSDRIRVGQTLIVSGRSTSRRS